MGNGSGRLQRNGGSLGLLYARSVPFPRLPLGEDGIAGISDNHQQLCFAIALWNGEDPILKERLFGLTGDEGNHGEDVKEYYFYIANTPTHSYMKYLYKYPQKAYPYANLVVENGRRSRHELEYELLDTGVFDENRYFDVFVEYAKASPEDILIQISVVNRGPDAKPLHLLPTLWFRNTWSWDTTHPKPFLKMLTPPSTINNEDTGGVSVIEAHHPDLGDRWLYCDGHAELLFTENETNYKRLFGSTNASPYVKDGINDHIVQGHQEAVNPNKIGTKVSAYSLLSIEPGETKTIRLRLSDSARISEPFGAEFDTVFQTAIQQMEEFYDRITPASLPEDMRNVQRQAFAGMLWGKQYYNYVIHDWLKGDPAMPPPPPERLNGRNHDWVHLHCDDVISMPDKWEYPWFAAWDLAFHLVPLVMLDPDFAKLQLERLVREWYMHPNGQLPAYEWAFGDVNPPVHAWAALHIYHIENDIYGRADKGFLERVFQKLLLNFTWWVNRKDINGKNIFQGGFLGLDNISVFDRSKPLPTGGHLNQADGTSWMGMFCLNMLAIALELARDDCNYEDIASKFFEHFLYIADAIDGIGNDKNLSLWDEEDGFYYDALHLPNGQNELLKVRSLVGLSPILAIAAIEPTAWEQFPNFIRRATWFVKNRPDLIENIASLQSRMGGCSMLAIVSPEKLRRILHKMLDENEFLSPHGIRALSRYHAAHPYIFHFQGQEFRVDYEPAESTTGLFGGNSNWRGPVWYPMNMLIIESLRRFHHCLGDDFKVECPTGSGQWMTLHEVSIELSHRLIRTFLNDDSNRRPVYGGIETFQTDPHWHDWLFFHEYFHGDNGAGIGANHQTGWTGGVAVLIQQVAKYKYQTVSHKNYDP